MASAMEKTEDTEQTYKHAFEEVLQAVYEGEGEGDEVSALKKSKLLMEAINKSKKENLGLYPKSEWEDDSVDEDMMEDIMDDPRKKFLWAAQNNDFEIVKELLMSDPELVHAVDEDSYTALHRAAYSNNPRLVEYLIENGADIHAKTCEGWLPLHCACRWNNAEVASILLQAGNDVNGQTNGGQTPLHLASSNQESEETLQLLLMHPCINPYLQNGGLETAHKIALRSGMSYYLFEMTEGHMQLSKAQKHP